MALDSSRSARDSHPSRVKALTVRSAVAVAAAAALTAGGGIAFASGGGTGTAPVAHSATLGGGTGGGGTGGGGTGGGGSVGGSGSGSGSGGTGSGGGSGSGVHAGHARVVRPGQHVPVPPHEFLWLTGGGLHLKFGPESPIDTNGTWSLDVAQVRRGDIGATGYGTAQHSVFFGIYRGPGVLDHVVVTAAGHRYRTQVFTLPGHPGWAAFLALGPGLPGNGPTRVSITGYAADGRILARHDRG